MNKKALRDFATSLTTLIFFVIGISGIMLYFHWFNTHVKQLHEIIGLAFVVAVFLHVFVNWGSMKNYFNKKIFYLSSAVIATVASVFILYSLTSTQIHPKKIIINSVMQAPIHDSLQILNLDYEEAKIKLHAHSIDISMYKSINELAKKNNIEALEVIVILKKE